MRIAMVSEHASPLAAIGGADAGGQNIHVAALARELVRRGHSVDVYTRRDDAALPERVTTSDGVEIVHVDAGPPRAIPKDELLPFMAAFGDRLTDHWGGSTPDVAHSHFWMSGVATLRAADALGDGRPATLHTFHALGNVKRRHQGADDTSPAEREFLEPDVGRRVDEVIATCSDEAFELIQLGIPSTRISVTPCGVDTEVFTPEGRTEERARAHRIVCVGRLVPRKGIGIVISALALLAERGRDDVELVVAGGSHPQAEAMADPEVRRLAALAESLGVADRVSFHGQVPHLQLPELLRSADLVACTPWYEPFGIVPLEAMACGVPVIASAVGGLIDTVVHGVTGLHVPPRDAAATAHAIDSLLSDPSALAAFGQGGVERVAHRYTWEKVAADTERAYLRVLDGQDPAVSPRKAVRG